MLEVAEALQGIQTIKRLNLSLLLRAGDFKDSWTVLFQESSFLSTCLYAVDVTVMYLKNMMMNMNFRCQAAKTSWVCVLGFFLSQLLV